MKLTKVNPFPSFVVLCFNCNKRLYSWEEDIFADLEGKPFKDYYCKACKEGSFLSENVAGRSREDV